MVGRVRRLEIDLRHQTAHEPRVGAHDELVGVGQQQLASLCVGAAIAEKDRDADRRVGREEGPTSRRRSAAAAHRDGDGKAPAARCAAATADCTATSQSLSRAAAGRLVLPFGLGDQSRPSIIGHAAEQLNQDVQMNQNVPERAGEALKAIQKVPSSVLLSFENARLWRKRDVQLGSLSDHLPVHSE